MKRNNRLKNYFNEWELTKNLYTSWVSETVLRKFFVNSILLRGISVWWATKLVSKDNLNDKTWYINLNNKINKKKIVKKIPKSLFFFYVIFFFKFFKNFFISILWNITIKLISFSRFQKIKNKNCFHSYNYNFFLDDQKNLFLDRCYRYGFSNSINKNFYLINVINKKNYLLNFFKFKKSSKVKYIIADEFINIFDICEIYFKSICLLIKLIFFLNSNKKVFYINNINCSEILKPFLISSFYGEIQNYILTGISVGNFFKKNRKIDKFITYGEFTPGYRPVYYFLKKNSPKTKIFTIQHGNANTNLIYNYNKKSEFTSNIALKGKFYSPSPDFYFTQGPQFNKILNSYFKSSKIIGPLKYDYHLISKKKDFSFKKRSKKKNILICPSIGDHEILLNFLKNSVNKKHNYVISPHPAFKEIGIKYLNILKNNCKIKYFKNRTTHELLKNTDLVICGFSSIAHEAAFVGVPSIRIMDLTKPFFHDLQDKIKIVYDACDLKKILSEDDFKMFLINYKIIEKNFYYKLDNRAYLRFTKAIN